MKKLFLLTAVLLLVGCGTPDKVPEAITITDMVGRKVDIKPGSYRRVVCIGAGALRLYSYVGDLNLLAGVEDIDNPSLENRPKMFDGVARPYFLAGQDVFKTLPSCGVGGPQAQAAEAEKILSCNPDIVISEYEDADKGDALQKQLGVPVVTMMYGGGGQVSDKLYDSLKLLGKVFNKETRAEGLANYYKSTINTIRSRTANATRRKGYICGLGNWGTTNQFMTAQNYTAFDIAGIDNVVNDLPKDGVAQIDEEKFTALSSNMDIMFFDAAAVKNIRGKEFDFSGCAAFNTGEVYLQMAYNAYYTNAETALINQWFLAKSAHPELFADINIETVADEIFQMFNGKALYSTVKELPQSYGGYQKIADPTEFFK